MIKLYDSTFHAALELDDTRTMEAIDRRWVKSRRPVVVVGGELTMQALDLVYSETSKFYEAPLQLKANCGMFLIDESTTAFVGVSGTKDSRWPDPDLEQLKTVPMSAFQVVQLPAIHQK